MEEKSLDPADIAAKHGPGSVLKHYDKNAKRYKAGDGANGNGAEHLDGADPSWPKPDTSVLCRVEELVPPIPLIGFGPILSVYIEKAAAALGAPVDYVALAVLCGAAGLIGARRHVEVWPGWREPAILWGALVGDPSTNKSPAIDPVREGLIAVEAEKLEVFKKEEEAYTTALIQAQAAKQAWKEDFQAAARAKQSLPEMPAEAREPKAPIRPRHWTANATIDKIARILAELPGGIICFVDELAGLIGSFNRYGGEGADRAFYLEGFGGRPSRVDRVKDGSIDIDALAVSIIGTIQPDRLNRLVLSGDNDGFASRFLYAWPLPTTKKRPVTVPDAAVLKSAFKRLGTLNFGSSAPVLPLTTDAASQFEPWWRGTHDADTKAATGLLAEAYAKFNGVALRIALVFEYLKWASAELWHGEPGEVTAASVEAAITFVDQWAKPMARRVFAEASIPQADRNAAVLAKYLLSERPKAINARQLRQRNKSALPGIRDAKSMDEASAALVDANWLRPKFTREGEGKGRRTKDFEVSPRLAGIRLTPRSDSSVSSDRSKS